MNGSVASRIKALRRTAPDSQFDELVDRIRALTKGYLVRAPVVTPGLFLFRGRVWAEQDRPSTVQQLRAPPAVAVTAFHRAGRPGQPMFYASIGKAGPFFELNPVVGSKFLLARWQSVREIIPNPVGYDSGALSRMNATRNHYWAAGPADSDHRLLWQFFSEELSRRIPANEQTQYKLPAAIAQAHLGGAIESILYPSIALDGRTDNIAMTPSSADRVLVLRDVELREIASKKGPIFRAPIIDAATVGEDNRLEWKGRALHWQLTRQGEELRMVSDGQDWHAYDVGGIEVFPS